jgi:hypothetical protein
MISGCFKALDFLNWWIERSDLTFNPSQIGEIQDQIPEIRAQIPRICVNF